MASCSAHEHGTAKNGAAASPLPASSRESGLEAGDPGKTRTSGPKFRKLVLYPAELRGHEAIHKPGKPKGQGADNGRRGKPRVLCPNCAPEGPFGLREIPNRCHCWISATLVDTERRFPKLRAGSSSLPGVTKS